MTYNKNSARLKLKYLTEFFETYYHIADYFGTAFIFGYFYQPFLFEYKFSPLLCCHHVIYYCFSAEFLQGRLRQQYLLPTAF